MKSLLKEATKHLKPGEVVSFRYLDKLDAIQVCISTTLYGNDMDRIKATADVTIPMVQYEDFVMDPSVIDDWVFQKLRKDMDQFYEDFKEQKRIAKLFSSSWSQDNTKGVPHV